MPIDLPAIEAILDTAWRDHREALFEHEVYRLLQAAGIASAPAALFKPVGDRFTADDLSRFAGPRVVLKLVASDLAHKSDVGGVRFVSKDPQQVNRQAAELTAIGESTSHAVAGVLCCNYVDHPADGLGHELYVGVRTTREFGPVIVAGLGGTRTEYLALTLQPAKAVAMAPADLCDGRQFFDRFRSTAAYDLVSGAARGFSRQVSDETLIDCFQGFAAIARTFCGNHRGDRPAIAEIEVNPFAFHDGKLIPLDGLCRIAPAQAAPLLRPIPRIERLLHPRSMAVIGVSGKSMNMGRVILKNVLDAGFDPNAVTVIKPGAESLDGAACVASIAELPRPVDLLVVAVDAAQAPQIAEQAIESGKVASVILIPGGMGETEHGKDAERRLRERIALARTNDPQSAPVFLGGNCLGVRSRPGRYDTMFIPADKLAKHCDVPPRPVAIISQSGAFVVSKLSKLDALHPTYAVSLGNQIDLTISDVMQFLEESSDIRVFGIYVEGFRDDDGLATARIVAGAVRKGKDVIFYKAGRTEAGMAAAAGHTASIAGDYTVCRAAMLSAGAIVAESFNEFENLLQLAAGLHGRECSGTRIGGISNAGYEAVGMADASTGPQHAVQFPALPDQAGRQLHSMLADHRLGALVNVGNPLDLTPMAADEVHHQAIEIMLDCPAIDAVVASFVPLTPTMRTTPAEISDPASLAHRLPELFKRTAKPLVVSIDSGAIYDAMAHAVAAAGIPVFRSVDDAVRTLGRYLCHKAAKFRPTHT